MEEIPTHPLHSALVPFLEERVEMPEAVREERRSDRLAFGVAGRVAAALGLQMMALLELLVHWFSLSPITPLHQVVVAEIQVAVPEVHRGLENYFRVILV